jgi:hypothetical protein
MRPASVVFALFLLAGSGPALAQSEAVKALVGGWEISNADREKVCNLTFKIDPVKSGFKVEFDKACATVFPVTKDVDHWAIVKDDLRLLDARGRVLFEFTEVETRMYEAERGEGLYFLQNQAAADPAMRRAEEMFGDWSLARGDKPVCTLSLTNGGAGGELGYALRVQPTCDDAVIARLNPVLWRMDRGELVLSAAGGQSIRFEESESGKWQRVPESPDGLTMSRK